MEKNRNPNDKISLLQKHVASSIRSSQVIGSIPRAIEELVHNSVLHGCAKVVVVMVGKNEGTSCGGGFFDEDSMSEVIVSDDGVGIDVDAMRMFIGTEYCSNVTDKSPFVTDADDLQSKEEWGRDKLLDQSGESLKSIATLCVEMKIESTCWYSEDCHNNMAYGKRKWGSREAGALTTDGYIKSSVKVIKDCTVVSFHESLGYKNVSSIIPNDCLKTQIATNKNDSIRQIALIQGQNSQSKILKTNTGTTITIRGLFHRHAVLRRQRQLENQEKKPYKRTNARSTESANFARIRSCIRMLALSYPLVTFRLVNGRSGKIDSVFDAPPWAQKFTGQLTCRMPTVTMTSPSLRDESRALIARLCEVYQTDFSQENCIELACEESQLLPNHVEKKNRSSMTSNNCLRAFGVLVLPKYEHVGEGFGVRSREFEIIAINGRQATYGNELADIVQRAIKQCGVNKSSKI